MNNIYNAPGNGSPYYDDFDVSKNYMQILYNPSVAVQARELTQSQTILQNQIASHSTYTFRNGTPITGANITISYNQPFFTAALSDNDGQPIDVTLLVGLTFVGSISGQRIIVNEVDSSNRNIYFSYVGSSITDGESFISTTTPTRSFSMTSGTLGTALVATCSEGTIFINGYFINVQKQHIVAAYNNVNLKYNIGFSITSNIITASDDSSLNDPASGSTNFNAPGANRYKINASLYSFSGDTVPNDINFIQGIVVENKKIIKMQPDPVSGSELMDVLAKRTYDESGSYTVEPWKVQLQNKDSDETKYIASIQEGSGYIKGYNVETFNPINIEISKPRTTVIKPDSTLFNDTGLYTLGLFDSNGCLSASILPSFNSVVLVKSETNGSGTTLGECYISSIFKEGTNLRIYLYNTSGVINSFAGAKSLALKTDTTKYINLYVNLSGCAELYGQENPFIYKSNEYMLKTISLNSLNYQILKTYSATSETSNNTIIISDANTTNDFLTSEGLIDIYDNSGNHLNVNHIVATPNNVGSTSTLTLTGNNIENNTDYKILLRIKIENIEPKTKIITTKTETITIANNTVHEVLLSKEDLYDVISVVQTTNKNSTTPDNLLTYLNIDNGQTDYLYGYGKLSGFDSDIIKSFADNINNSTKFTVTYRYFEHDGTGPICVNSYMNNININSLSDINVYNSIPTYKSNTGIEYTLRDCFDFRVKSSEVGQYHLISPRTELTSEVEKYVPRYDVVYVTPSGDFGVLTGIPAEVPSIPSLSNSNALRLYNLYINAYCFDVNDIVVSYIDNQRYTMKDINSLDIRIKNVEDAVSISQLEQSALNMQIVDSDGLNKYKTGIFTDNFSSFDNCDYKNTNWNANIDALEQSLRCDYNAKNFVFENNAASNVNILKSDKTIQLNYSTSIFAKNDFVSNDINVQKLMFYVWVGSAKLTPAVDTWVNDLGRIVVGTSSSYTTEPSVYKSWSTSTSENIFNHETGVDLGFGLGYNVATGQNDLGIGKTVTTTTTTTAKENFTSSWVASESITNRERQDQYMRQRSVTYNLTGMRPGMRVSAMFGDIPLTLSDNLVKADTTMTGTFTVPANVPVGKKIVRFVDSENTSSADTTYQATGKTVWQDVFISYSQVWTSTGTYTKTGKKVTTSECPYDPVAETFYVEEPNGIFIESIDVFFKEKDSSMPVWLYVTTTENGYPSSVKLPLSTVYKQPSEVNVSDKATIATNFKFESPIYLEGGKEYSFVVATASYKYKVFISTLGEPDLNTGIGIYEQPYLGSMFISQNARTWTPQQQSDVTFNIYKCAFNTSETGTAIFDLEIPEEDFSTVMQNLVINDQQLTGTSIKYEYKWSNDSVWTEFVNKKDTDLTTEKTIQGGSAANTSLKIKATIKTTDSNLTPMIDLERVYGIFCNNTVIATNDNVYPYDAGTYLSKTTTLKYESNDMRVILDAICPNQSDVDVYFQTTSYKPTYVLHGETGTIGIDNAALVSSNNKILKLYYYNSTDHVLEPMTDVEMTGYDLSLKRIYLNQVGEPSLFKNISNTDNLLYTGLDVKYTDLVLLPIISSVNIPLNNWTSTSTYIKGKYVIYNKNIWKAVRDAAANVIPSSMSTTWELIPSLRTVSTTTYGDEIVWRSMKKSSNSYTDAEKGTNFIEYTYYPEIIIEQPFKTFIIKVVMKSKDVINIPRVKNLRAIATV